MKRQMKRQKMSHKQQEIQEFDFLKKLPWKSDPFKQKLHFERYAFLHPPRH